MLRTRTEIEARLTPMKEKLEPLSEYAAKINNFDTASENLQRTIEQQKALNELGDRARKNNLVFGVTETGKETRKDTEKKVLKKLILNAPSCYSVFSRKISPH